MDEPPIRATSATTAEWRRFLAAVGVFLVWVGLLGALAVISGRRPESSSAPVEKR